MLRREERSFNGVAEGYVAGFEYDRNREDLEGTIHRIDYGYDGRGVRVTRNEPSTAGINSKRYFMYSPELRSKKNKKSSCPCPAYIKHTRKFYENKKNHTNRGMFSHLAMFAMLIAVSCGGATRIGETADVSVSVTVTPRILNGNPRLHVQITNTGASTIQLHAGSLPWREMSAIQLIAIEDTFEAETLARAVPFGHSGPHIYKLMRGTSIGGDVRLEDHFPAIKEKLTRVNVIVYWNMRVEPLDGQASKRFLGGVVLDRRIDARRD